MKTEHEFVSSVMDKLSSNLKHLKEVCRYVHTYICLYLVYLLEVAS